ncbi:zinc finger domain-containing protein [Mycobacterium persicum]|uniref:zinc finger domain-containing protein n=1 Tax=Mycobacterium persicum TaxID=1487726 RepID=UPI000A46F161
MRENGEPDLTADDQDVNLALTQPCGLCGAQPGAACRNTVRRGQPLPGRQVHHYRIPIQRGTSA